MSTPVFLHVDMDAFYASVEQRDHPEYAGKPVIVGAAPGHRGVVSACSYEARTFGIHSAMPISQAHRLCPAGVYLPVRMQRYQEVSSRIMAILAGFSPSVQQLSVDEAFLDITGTRRLFGEPIDIARSIKTAVRAQTGLTISVGIAPNRYLSKLASEVDKPDGLYQVVAGTEAQFVAGLPLRSLWGVGRKMLSTLNELGIMSVMELRDWSKEELGREVGHGSAEYLWSICRGIDPGLYGQGQSHSISGERTFEHDTTDRDALEATLAEIAESCVHRLIDEGGSSRTVTAKIRLGDFTTNTLRSTIDHDIATTAELLTTARELIYRKWDGRTPIRLVGCGLANVAPRATAVQSDLFDPSRERRRRVEEVVHRLAGEGKTVTTARLIRPSPRRDDG